MFADLDDDSLDRVFEAWESPAAKPIIGLSIRVLGGALAAPPARPGIAGAVTEPHVVSGHAIGVPAAAGAVRQGYETLRAALGPAASDRTLCTFLAPHVGYSGAYAESDVARAARVKATVDPEGRFRGNRDFV